MDNKWLSLSKNTEGPRYIVDAEGKPFHLFGMARCQYHQNESEDPVYGGIDGLCAHFRDCGCNIFRLAIDNRRLEQGTDLIEECGGYHPAGIRAFIERYVEPDVRAIIKNGLYVSLDLHLYPPTNVATEIVPYAREHYIPIWRELAGWYRDEPMVALYELWNEPYPADQGTLSMGDDGFLRGGEHHDYNWNKDVRAFFLDCVEEVRKYDRKHMIMVSDYNAGWGCGWAMTWHGHVHEVDLHCRNTLFSIHAAADHLGPRFEFFDDWWASICSVHNAAIQFGEIETEEDLMRDEGIINLVKMFEKRAGTHHYSGILWRPHDDRSNYVHLWKDFAKAYASRITSEEGGFGT